MKLTKDTPGLLTKKWCRKSWCPTEWIQFNGLTWATESGSMYATQATGFVYDDWQEWTPPKVKRSKKIYANVYAGGVVSIYSDRTLADTWATNGRITCVESEICWEE